MPSNLFTRANPKTRKGEALGYDTLVLHLAPASVSGFNVCPDSTPGCREACLNTAGRGFMAPIQAARIRRTRAFFADRPAFMRQLAHEIRLASARAHRSGRNLAVRLNGTSDLPWERITCDEWRGSLMDLFPHIQFYDYTKSLARALAFRKSTTWPQNYHLTFSMSECNAHDAAVALESGCSVVVVASFPHDPTAEVNGDSHDLRFLNPPGSMILLKPKGRAKRDTSGFVVRFRTAA